MSHFTESTVGLFIKQAEHVAQYVSFFHKLNVIAFEIFFDNTFPNSKDKYICFL